MTVSTVAREARARLLSMRKRDSGVVTRMSPGLRTMRWRSRWGVSPVRSWTRGTRGTSPRASVVRMMPARGARRLRSMSAASAFSGEM